MDKNLIKPEHPAKSFLSRYRAIVRRCDALKAAIDELHGMATSITVRPNPDKVQSSGGAYDRMAEDACKAVDVQHELEKEMANARATLKEILRAIDSVQDETQKTLLTMRYVAGLSWPDIQDRLGYERTQTYVIHGWALQAVKKWIDKRADENGLKKVV